MLKMKNQTSFTQHLVSEIIRRQRIFAKHSKLSAGFVPMIIMILIIIIVFLWVAFRRVSSTHS